MEGAIADEAAESLEAVLALVLMDEVDLAG
jgi:hypothetical protein